MIYCVSTRNGLMTLVSAPDRATAINKVRADLGRHDPVAGAHEATDEDIDWVRSMHGRVPRDDYPPRTVPHGTGVS